MQMSMFSSAEHHASPSVSRESEADWMIRVATSRLSLLYLLTGSAPTGFAGRTSPAFFPAPADRTSRQSSRHLRAEWLRSRATGGKRPAVSPKADQDTSASPGECLTLSMPEFRSGAVACSLSDILETGDVPQQYFLTATACRGILRRAAKRGKELPTILRQALQAVAAESSAEEIRADKIRSSPSQAPAISPTA